MKNKITFTVVVEYDVNPDNYPAWFTDDQRLAIDLENANEDPFMMLGDDADWLITGEVIK